MEDDDEFGDLYTDILLPFASTSSSAPQPPSSSRSIDLNLQTDQEEETFHAASYPNSDVPHPASNSKQDESSEGAMVPERGDAESAEKILPDMNHGRESSFNDVCSEVAAVRENDLMEKDVKFDIEEDGDGIKDVGSGPIIPGLSSDAGVFAPGRIDEGDDWDSDSEDDLQIVLNDNHHMNVERGGMMGNDDDDDEDSELVIVADGDPIQAVEEQEWGENSIQSADGERKDMGDSAKASGGVTVAPKMGYSNHGFHPFHSQFKYVRPGAAPIPGATMSTPGVSTSQIRPLANMVPAAGRGRGDWRPPGIKGAATMQKGFHAGPGLPVWGNSAAGRGFGGGLEFTLPSHKSIFDVDIESFEEKPWKYPGVDASDFFNFGLNEETWKDYCRQLEQLRLESTMQSKIRVYESGRTEKEYDPDLPPELAAASGIHDVRVESTNPVKSDIGQSDLVKGSGRVRPPLPTGRAIQVEGGYGERLPSIDTRPPRVRDPYTIIEIVLQDSADDDSYAGPGVDDQSEGGEPQREDLREDGVLGDEIPQVEREFSNGFPQDHNGRKRDLAGRRLPFMNSTHPNIPGGNETLPSLQEEPVNCSGSGDPIPRSCDGNFGSSYEERQMQGRASSHIMPSREMEINNKKEDSVESMEGKDSALLTSPIIKDARESSVEDKDADLDEIGMADENSRMEKEEMDLNTVDKNSTLEDQEGKRQKSTSQVEEPLLNEVDDWENSKAASSDNSKASLVRSKGYQKRQEEEEEVVQDAQSEHLGGHRRDPNENEHDFHRREHGGRQGPERNPLLHKGREESYPYKDQHPSSVHHLHMKTGSFDGHKDRDSDIVRARRDDDPFGRRIRNDEPRKRDKGKVRENDRNDRDDSLHSRKHLDNGSYRIPYDKDIGLRDAGHRDKDDGLKSRYEAVEDYHSKKRKEEEYLRREHIDKEENLHGYRESASRRKRERDVVLDPRKRNDQQRSRDNLDDHYAAKRKDEGLLPKERTDRQREKEEWHRVKHSHEENPSKREREGQIAVRSGRIAEEKTWVGHVRAQDEHKVSVKEYKSRDTIRHGEQLKRRDRDESPLHKGREDAYTRGNQYSSEEKRSRQERSSSHGDRIISASNNQRVNDRKHKEGTRRSKESDVSDHNSLGLSKRNQEGQSGQINKKGLKGFSDEGRSEQEIPGHRLSRKCKEDFSSDDEQQDSRRGRSKLERWTSHKERDFSVSSKPSSSLKFKDIDESANTGANVDNQHILLDEGKDSVDMESKDADTNGLEDQHLDTVEKLKKRSERFKLPMRSEKEAVTIKKLEREPLPSAKSENPDNSEVKQERPARKRRWISN
ncbi:FIP1[V]-like protein [Senna tora]|uniref:FIP1[V]-like protein n=1 Tax=Senna tora TaxID=362788 RepID=A0A834W5E8_9FABA|nr:FIP1[V]-like protein [Senna tora]